MRRLFKIARRMRDRRLRIAVIQMLAAWNEYGNWVNRQEWSHPEFHASAKRLDSAVANLNRVRKETE